MNPLLLTLINASLKYAFDAIERRRKLTGTEPTYEEVWADIRNEMAITDAEFEAWKASKGIA